MTGFAPCPFCAGGAVDKHSNGWGWIECQGCGAKGPAERIGHGGSHSTAWNCRGGTVARRFDLAVEHCHVRAAIYRVSAPGARYWKDCPIPIEQRVPLADQSADDWAEHDPKTGSYEVLA